MFASSSAASTPRCAIPLAPPPERTRPKRFMSLIFLKLPAGVLLMRNKDGQIDRLDQQVGMAGAEEIGDLVAAIGAHDDDGILFLDVVREQLVGSAAAMQHLEMQVIEMGLEPLLQLELFLDCQVLIFPDAHDLHRRSTHSGEEMRELPDGKGGGGGTIVCEDYLVHIAAAVGRDDHGAFHRAQHVLDKPAGAEYILSVEGRFRIDDHQVGKAAFFDNLL